MFFTLLPQDVLPLAYVLLLVLSRPCIPQEGAGEGSNEYTYETSPTKNTQVVRKGSVSGAHENESFNVLIGHVVC